MSHNYACVDCINYGRRHVPGRGPRHTTLMLVGEAPGADEEREGICWIGKAGKELANYLRVISKIDIDQCYLTNLIKCRPPNNRDPRQSEIMSCAGILEQEIRRIKPKIIACLGRYSTRYFLGNDVSLESVHGVPIKGNDDDGDVVILPMYHPAAGLHNTSMMTLIAEDFDVLGRVACGEAVIGVTKDEYPDPEYLVSTPRTLTSYLRQSNVVSIDTESVKDNSRPWYGGTEPWCISVSVCPGTAMVVNARSSDEIRVVSEKLADDSVTTLIHNSMYDLPILDQMGIKPAVFYDTMVMAYLTQSLPQGLKELASRLCSMRMRNYDEMIHGATVNNSEKYLRMVAGEKWPELEPELVWGKSGPRVKSGWPLHKRVASILSDSSNSKDDRVGGDGEEVDLVGRWHNIEPKLRRQAEVKFGIMPIGDLSEIQVDEAIKYSGRDADATYRVFPLLLERITNMNIDQIVPSTNVNG